MAISTPFIRRPIATSLLMAGILLVGAVAYPLLPVAPLPQVDFPTIQVNTQFPGGGPETMASSVTAPLERQFAQIPGVTQMTSSSTLGNSSITVQFDLNRSIDAATRTFTIDANDQLLSAEPWNDVIIAYKKGAPVRVRDIGHAIEGPENTKQAAWANSKRAINLMILKQPGANVVDTVDRIKAVLPQLQAAMPPAVKVDILSDRTTTIRASINDEKFTLGLAIAVPVM